MERTFEEIKIMANPLKNKLRCSICHKLIEYCKCTNLYGSKYEPDLKEDVFIGSDVKSAVEGFVNELIDLSMKQSIKPPNIAEGKRRWFPDISTPQNKNDKH